MDHFIQDKLVSSVCKYDSANGNLNYCGTICLQMNEEATLKPTTEFFNMILYNSDPNSKVYLRRFLNPQNVTKVSPQDDIEGINNFDIFVIQVKASYFWLMGEEINCSTLLTSHFYWYNAI